MVEYLEGSGCAVYPLMQVLVEREQPLLLLLGVVGGLHAWTGVLRGTLGFVHEVP